MSKDSDMLLNIFNAWLECGYPSAKNPTDDFVCGYQAARAESAREIEELKHEIDEQCRINGMGGERELKLMAEVEELKRDAALNQQDLERTLQLANDFSEENERLQRVVNRLTYEGEITDIVSSIEIDGEKVSNLMAVAIGEIIAGWAAAEKESAK